MPPTPDPGQILQLCLNEGDTESWAAFVAMTQRLIAGVVLKVCRGYHDVRAELVEDLVQETYLRLCKDNFRVLRAFEPTHENSIFALVKVVAANAAHDHFRSVLAGKRDQRLAVTPEEMELHPASELRTDPAAEGHVLLAEIQTRLNTLVEGEDALRQKLVFWLYYRDGLTARAIASVRGVNLTTKGVESMLLRLTRMMKEDLAGGSALKGKG